MLTDLKELVSQLGYSTSPVRQLVHCGRPLYHMVLFCNPHLPHCHCNCHSQNLVFQLLQFNPMERLGAGVAGVEDIKSHPFFTPVDWAELTR